MAMAQFSGSYGRNMTLEVWSDWNRQDIASNSSTVNVQARLITNGYASMWGVTADVTVTVDGKNESSSVPINVGTNSSYFFYGKDFVVPHNGDGKKTVGIKIYVGINAAGYGSSMVAFDLPLPTIERASTATIASSELGKVATITIDRKNSSFKHTLRYNWDGLTGTIATNVDTSYNWTLPLDFANTVPNANSHWGTVYIDTYSGSTKIGTKEATFNANIPASIKPTLGSISLSDANTKVSSLLGTSNTFVQVLSNIKVAFNNASGAYSSTISNYHAEIVDKKMTTTSNGGALGMMNFNGSATIRATVTDSRGRTSEPVEVEVNVLPYFTPQLSFTAQRSGSAGTTVTVTRNAKIAPLTVGDKQKNTMKLSFKYKRHSQTDDEFVADTGNAGGTWTTVSELVNSQANLGAVFSSLVTYDIVGHIEDSLTSYDFKATVGTEQFPTTFRPDGIGIGKTPERANAVDSDWQYYFNNKPIQHHQLTNNAGRSPYNAPGTVDLDTKTVNEFFSCNQPLHGPVVGTGANEFYVAVYSESDSFLSQQAIQKGTGRMFTRTRHAWTWSNWIEYAQLNSVAEFTTVNQTKVYTGTINGPYGFNIAVTRSGNVVTATMDYIHRSNTNWNGTANETIPVGWRPASQAIINAIGEGGGGSGSTLFNGSYVHLSYKPDGSISGRIKLEANPLWFGATISWITTDPFPS